tara:strand:- start:77 stop:886 length:810 start_codon:yes stop_codon:yes gene_type:complete
MKKSKMNIINIIASILILYLIIVIFIFFYQRKLLYHPSENNYLDETNLNHKIERVYIQSDNELVAWHYTKDKKFKTILFFHGNAGKLDNRVYKLNELSRLDVNYLIVAYRGFSGNKGNPSEKGLYMDSLAAKNWLNNIGVEDESIILYGESLGTAVAVNLASENKFAGIILESPFTSMVKLAKKYYPYLPVKILLKDKYESEKKLRKINIPILVMHGEQDTIVPFEMGKRIYEISLQPKYKYFNKIDDHMMDYNSQLMQSINQFINSLN